MIFFKNALRFQRCLERDEIPLDKDEMEPRVVYMQRPEFAKYPYDQFWDSLRDLRTKFWHCHPETRPWDSSTPKKLTNHRGEPRWEGSKAKRNLKHHIDKGKQDSMEPKDLYKTRIEYQDYPLEVFRKHIQQEVKRHKFTRIAKIRLKRRRTRRQRTRRVHNEGAIDHTVHVTGAIIQYHNTYDGEMWCEKRVLFTVVSDILLVSDKLE